MLIKEIDSQHQYEMIRESWLNDIFVYRTHLEKQVSLSLWLLIPYRLIQIAVIVGLFVALIAFRNFEVWERENVSMFIWAIGSASLNDSKGEMVLDATFLS